MSDTPSPAAPAAAGATGSRRWRYTVVAMIAIALVGGVAWFTVTQLHRAAVAEDARADAGTISAAFIAAQSAHAESSGAVADAGKVTAVAQPVLEAAADSAHLAEEAVGALQAGLEQLTDARDVVDELGPAALDAPFDAVAGLEQRLVEHYWSVDDLEAARAASGAEAGRLEGLAAQHAAGAETVRAAVQAVVGAVRDAADDGVTSGAATLSEHDRASDDTRAGLAAAIHALEDLSAALTGSGDPVGALTDAEPVAELFATYTASAEAVRASHDEVIAAEKAAEEAARRAAEKAAADEAARKARQQPSGGGGSENGGGSGVCTYLGFGGTVQIKPCG